MSIATVGALIAGAAVVLWAMGAVRVMRSHERRWGALSIPIMGLLASLGSLVSVSVLVFVQAGVGVNLDAASVLATAIGRGALLMGAILWLVMYRRR